MSKLRGEVSVDGLIVLSYPSITGIGTVHMPYAVHPTRRLCPRNIRRLFSVSRFFF